MNYRKAKSLHKRVIAAILAAALVFSVAPTAALGDVLNQEATSSEVEQVVEQEQAIPVAEEAIETTPDTDSGTTVDDGAVVDAVDPSAPTVNDTPEVTEQTPEASTHTLTYRVAEDDTPSNPDDNNIKKVDFVIAAGANATNLAAQANALANYLPSASETQPFITALNNRYEGDEDYKIIGWTNPDQNPTPNFAAGEDFVVYTDDQNLYNNEPGFANIAHFELKGDAVLEARFVAQSWQPSYLGTTNEPQTPAENGNGATEGENAKEGDEASDSDDETDKGENEGIFQLLSGGISLLSATEPVTITGVTLNKGTITEEGPNQITTSSSVRFDVFWEVTKADMPHLEYGKGYQISLSHPGLRFSTIGPLSFSIDVDGVTVNDAGTFQIIRDPDAPDDKSKAKLVITFSEANLKHRGLESINNGNFFFQSSVSQTTGEYEGGKVGDIDIPKVVVTETAKNPDGEWGEGRPGYDFSKSSWRVTNTNCLEWKIIVNVNNQAKAQIGNQVEPYENALIFDEVTAGTEICKKHGSHNAEPQYMYVPIYKVNEDGVVTTTSVYLARLDVTKVELVATTLANAKAEILSKPVGTYAFWNNPATGQDVFLFNSGTLPANSPGGLELIKTRAEIETEINKTSLTAVEKQNTIASLDNIFSASSNGVIGFVMVFYAEVIDPDLAKDATDGKIKNHAILEWKNGTKDAWGNVSNYEHIGGGAEATLKKDEIEIAKVDSANKTTALPGVEFRLYEITNTSPETLKEITHSTNLTDSNGKIKFGGLTKGKYLLREVAPPTGYTLAGAKFYVSGNSSSPITPREPGEYVFDFDADAGVRFVMENVLEKTSVSLKALKTATGKDMTADQFSFELFESNAAGDEVKSLKTSTNTSAGASSNVEFGSFEYTSVGNYYYLVKETSTSGNGWTVDTTEYLIKVAVTASEGKLVPAITYAAKGENGFPAEGTWTSYSDQKLPTFNNTYIPQSTTADLAVSKKLTGRDLKANEFEFVAKLVKGDPSKVTGLIDSKIAANNTSVTDGGTVSFDTLTFSAADTYVFEISETAESLGGITYDTIVFYARVVVAVSGSGDFSATVTYHKSFTAPSTFGEEVVATFNNDYKSTDAEAAFAADKSLDGRTLTDKEFEFVAKLMDNNVNNVVGLTNGEITAKNATDGSVNFDKLFFQKAGTYSFKITEKVPASVAPGITYSNAVFWAVVTVTDNGVGAKSATVAYYADNNGQLGNPLSAGSKPAFENKYDSSDISAALAATKDLTGRTLAADEFSFVAELTAGVAANITGLDSSNKITAKNAADGSVAFGSLTFKKVGSYTFKISEVVPSNTNGVTYSTAIFWAVVTVADNYNGTKSVAISYREDNGGQPGSPLGAQELPTFVNSYASSDATASFKATKKLTGRTLTANEFDFVAELTDNDAKNVVGLTSGKITAKNLADGSVNFGNLTFKETGTYTFKISEVDPSVTNGVTYSTAIFWTKVTVTDNGDGTKSAAVTYHKDNNGQPGQELGAQELPKFENKYDSSDATAALAATKTLTGRDLEADEFEFVAKLTAGTASDVTGLDADNKITAKNLADSSVTFDSLDFAETGTYTFKITESIPATGDYGITYSEAIFWAVVTVTDNGDGTKSAAVVYYEDNNGQLGNPLATDTKPTFENDYKEYDAALRKWVSDVNNVIADGDNTTVPADDLLASIATAESGTPSDAVKVKGDDYVTYTIRIFNQCAFPLAVPRVIDDLPEGLEFVTADADGNAINDGWTKIYSAELDKDILAYEYAGAAPVLAPSRDLDGDFINADESYSSDMYTDIYVTLKVKLTATEDNLLNTAEIAKLTDEDGNEVPDVDSVPDENPYNDEIKDNEIEEHGRDKEGNKEDGDEDDNDIANLTLTPIVLSVEVDKDTIKRTSAAFHGRTHGVESSTAGVHIDNIGSEEYLYNFDFRSTSSIAAEEFNVIDSLEAVDHGHITVNMFVTPSVHGDKDGLVNVWVKTKSGSGIPHGAAAPSAHQIYADPASEGWILWAGGISATSRERLAIYASDTLGSYNLGLADGDYVTQIMLEYGAVEVGFTSRNSDVAVSNGHHRDSNGVTSHYGSAIQVIGDHEQTDHEDALPKGETSNWTPDESRHDHTPEAAAATGLAPASYLVIATKELHDTDIVSSVKAYIGRSVDGLELKDADQDAVLTQQIESFTTEPENIEVNGVVEEDSFLKNADDQGVTFRNGQVNLPNSSDKSMPKTGDLAGMIPAIALLALLGLGLLVFARRKRQQAVEGEFSQTKRKSNKDIGKLFISAILAVGLVGVALPLDVAEAALGDKENLVVEYRYSDGDPTPDIPPTVTQFGIKYRLVDTSDAVLESTLPSIRTYTFNIQGALTADQMNDISLVPNVAFTPVTIPFEREVDKTDTITGLATNDVDEIPVTRDFLCTSATDPSGQAMTTLDLVGVEYSDPVKDSFGLPVGYDAHVVYRGVETYNDIGYYTAEATYRTDVEEGSTNTYIIVAEYEPVVAKEEPKVSTPAEKDPEPEPETEEPEAPAPANTTNIFDNGIPLSAGSHEAWSLLNLLMGLVALAISAVMLFTVIRKKKEPEYTEGDFVWQADEDHENGGEWVKPAFYRRRNFLKILTLVLCLVPGILFLILENVMLPMSWVTEWTPFIGAFFIIAMIAFIVQLVLLKPVESKVTYDANKTVKPLA